MLAQPISTCFKACGAAGLSKPEDGLRATEQPDSGLLRRPRCATGTIRAGSSRRPAPRAEEKARARVSDPRD